MKKAILLLIIISFIPFCTTGCFNYKDVNRTLFVTTIMIDIDSLNNTILYAETFIPSRGNQVEVGVEKKTIFKSKAASLFDAARNLSLKSNYEFNYSQCRAIIFSSKAASYGVDNFLDLFDRSQQLPLRSYIFITPGNMEKIINTKMEEEQYVGIFLAELAQNTTLSSKGTVLRIDEFLNKRFLGSKVNLVNIIELESEQGESRLHITGLAVLKEDKFIDKLNLQESMAYNFMNNTFRKGTISTTNPEHQNKLATIEILKNKTKTNFNFDGQKIYLKKKINSEASFAFTEKSIHITEPKQRYTLEKNSEEYMKKICKKLFSDYKEKDIDIFNIQREFNIRYPKSKIDNCLKITELELDTNVNIKGSNDTKNFQ